MKKYIYTYIFLVFLDGQKSKEELLAAVCKDVFQEIDKLMGKVQLFSQNTFRADGFSVSDIISLATLLDTQWWTSRRHPCRIRKL